MTIHREEIEVKPLRHLAVKEVNCDACGAPAMVTRAASPADIDNRRPVPWSRFELVWRNTPQEPLSETAMFNEAVLVGVADLCEDCAGRVGDFIASIATGTGGRSGIRPPTEMGE